MSGRGDSSQGIYLKYPPPPLLSSCKYFFWGKGPFLLGWDEKRRRGFSSVSVPPFLGRGMDARRSSALFTAVDKRQGSGKRIQPDWGGPREPVTKGSSRRAVHTLHTPLTRHSFLVPLLFFRLSLRACGETGSRRGPQGERKHSRRRPPKKTSDETCCCTLKVAAS